MASLLTALSCSVGVSSSFSTMRRVISSTRARASGGRPDELRFEPRQLRLADRLEPLAERDDGGDDLARLHPRGEPRHFLFDDRFGALELPAAPGEVLVDDRPQVVDVVEEHLIEVPDGRLDVARHGDVDDEERPVAPRPHGLLDPRPSEHRIRRPGRGDHDVGGGQRVVEPVPAGPPLRRAASPGPAPSPASGSTIAIRLTCCAWRWTPVSFAISPAPTIRTLRPFRCPKIFFASAIAA